MALTAINSVTLAWLDETDPTLFEFAFLSLSVDLISEIRAC